MYHIEQGLVPEATRKIIEYGFIELKLNKIWCGYFDGNTKSKRVQEKCGFQYHHTKRDVYWKAIDDVRTEHISCLTKSRWEKLKI